MTFFDHLKELYEKKGGAKLQSLGWNRASALGLPTFSLKELETKKFQIPSKKNITFQNVPEKTLVFLNGEYSEELSNKNGLPPEWVILPLSKATTTYASFLQGRFNTLKEEKDTFAALNAALCQEGLFIYIPPKQKMEGELTILHLVETDSILPLFTPRIHLFAGKESRLNIVLKETSSAPYWSNGVFDCVLDEKSEITLTAIMKLGAEAWHMHAVRASLKKGSQFKALTVTNGSKMVRFDFHVALTGVEASCLLEGAAFLQDNREAHVNVWIEHLVPHTYSRQKFKNVLLDNSKGSFEGKIKVQKEALKTEAYQVNHNLVLSHHASVTTKPNLEIFADDVKASHGATIGRLDPEHLFYLKSRGLSEKEAKDLLVKAFLRDVHPEALLWLC